MSDPQSKLSIFDQLSQETILKLADFFNESIITTPPDESEIRKIIGNDFKNEDIEKIISAFFNFIRSKLYPEKILEIIDNVELEEDKKVLLKEIIQKIHDRIDPKDVGLEETSFKRKNQYCKSWNLDAISNEFNLQDIPIWVEFIDKQNLDCSSNFFKERKALQNISISNKSIGNENIENKNAFEDFVKTNLNNPKFKNKIVAFVHRKFQDVGDKRNALIEKMYDQFGNVNMYVDKVTDQKKVILIDTPEFH